MSRASGCLWLTVGIILALVAGGVAFVTLQRAAAARAAGPAGPTTPVVVAARPLTAGTLLAESDLTTQLIPSEARPAGALTSVSDAVGQITLIDLNIGEMVLAHHLARPDLTAENLGFTLPQGQVAVALPADGLMSKTRLIKPGTRVDILYSFQIEQAVRAEGEAAGTRQRQQYTFGALQGATVVAVISSMGVEPGTGSALPGAAAGPATVNPPIAYILALDPQDALALKYLQDAGATMDLVIRNVADESEHEMEPVDLRYLIDRYQLPVR